MYIRRLNDPAQTDEALCLLAARGDRDAEEALVTRYYPLVRSCARPLALAGGDGEDLIQEGMLGLIRAMREYSAEKEASFHTFAEVCIRNRLYSALRSAQCDKHSPLNRSIPLDAPFFDSDPYCAGVSGAVQPDPEEALLLREAVQQLLERTMKQLSEFEANVLGYYLDGYSCQEIAAKVNKPTKSVDNAVQRVKRKAARQLSSGEFSIG